ncbi:MAG: ParB N-terminal domain-containing protein [Candidatus Latescibacterota bacterium]
MDLEHHQIDLRYEFLRKQDPAKERQLFASLDEVGQACPVVVLAQKADIPFVLLDGYKRQRALKRLKRDTVRATVWELDEPEALLLERMMRTSWTESPLEQGLLLRELQDRFGMSLQELGDRFARTPSWVSRRLGMVRDLPAPVQEHVCKGRISPHTAMKVLLPLARANRMEALRFLEVLLRAAFSTREAAALQTGWLRGDPEVRERILENPRLFLRIHGEDPAGLKADLKDLSAVARRALSRVGEGAVLSIAPRVFRQAQADCQALFSRLEKEVAHA